MLTIEKTEDEIQLEALTAKTKANRLKTITNVRLNLYALAKKLPTAEKKESYRQAILTILIDANDTGVQLSDIEEVLADGELCKAVRRELIAEGLIEYVAPARELKQGNVKMMKATAVLKAQHEAEKQEVK